MTLETKSGPLAEAAPDALQIVLLDSVATEAPPSRLPRSAPPKDEGWLSDALRFASTAARRRVVEELSRSDGCVRTFKTLAQGALASHDIVRGMVARLIEERLLECEPMTAPGRGLIGYRWTLFGAPVDFPTRDELDVSKESHPGHTTFPPGMDSGFAGVSHPGTVLPMSPLGLMHAKDEESFAEEHVNPAHERAMHLIARLEKTTGQRIHGRGRQLLIAALRDHYEGVRRCWNEAAHRGTNRIGLLVRMIQDGDHLEKETSE